MQTVPVEEANKKDENMEKKKKRKENIRFLSLPLLSLSSQNDSTSQHLRDRTIPTLHFFIEDRNQNCEF